MKREPFYLNLLSSLIVRLVLAFGLVIVLTILVVALLANRVTTREFGLYVSRGREARAAQLAPSFAQYYEQIGSWQGVQDALTASLGSWMMGRGMMMRGGRGTSMMMGQPDRILLADAQGAVVADTADELIGQSNYAGEMEGGTAVVVRGKQVGTLWIVGPAPADPLQLDFLHQVNRALVIGGLTAGAVGILLGFVLARGLAAPIRALTAAAKRMSGGDLDQRVIVRGTAEVAELGRAFNEMAASLVSQETLRRDLMAEIAHELRTPLSVVRADVEALMDGVYEPTPERLASLQDEVLLLGRLIDDLRALSLAEAGQLQLRRETGSVREIVAAEAATFATAADERSIRLDWRPPDDPLLAEVDAQRVRQMVGNLLSNAMRHTPSGQTITVSAGLDGHDNVQIAVADTGSGIAAEDLPHVFERFWRSDTGLASEGSGLGLAIVKRLAQAHGGDVWVESQSGRGAAFYVSLPRK